MRFGRYRLVRPVGAGGMAEIWKATAEGPHGFQKVLAIKRVLPAFAEDESFVRLFIEEAKLAATLVHPNVVQVFDFGEIEGGYFIAMEYVAGTNLAQLARRVSRRGRRLPADVILAIGVEACRGLACAHARRVVHRDVSPQNLLVSFGGEVKVTDFGIAKAAASAARTAAGQLRGKLAYMSPEQVRSAPLDGRSDLFALGVVLHELFTGAPLFGGAGSEEVYRRVLEWRGPSALELGAVPEEARAVLSRALAADPAERFDSAGEMEAALAHVAGLDSLLGARVRLAGLVTAELREEARSEAIDDSGGGATLRSLPEGAATRLRVRAPAALFAHGSTLPFVSDDGTRTNAARSPDTRRLARERSRPGARWPWALAAVAAIAGGGVIATAGPDRAGASGGVPLVAAASIATVAPGDAAIRPRAPAPERASAPTRTRSPAPVAATPSPRIPPTARLTVEAGPATRAWLDSRPVEPNQAVALAPGTHTVRIRDVAHRYDAERTFEVAPGATDVQLVVDAPSRSIRLSMR